MSKDIFKAPEGAGRVVAMVIHKDFVFVATEYRVYVCMDGELKPMKWKMDDE